MSGLVVHLNRGELYDVEPAVASFESAGDFAVELRNHGQPVHVHLRLDEQLSGVAALSGTNHYVESESVARVPVSVAGGGATSPGDTPSVSGTLKVVTGYGKATDHVEVSLSPDDEEAAVAVDGDLGRAAPAEDATDERGAEGLGAAATERLPGAIPAVADRVDVRMALIVGIAVAVALAAGTVAALAARGMAVVVGIFAVLVGLAVAGYLLVR